MCSVQESQRVDRELFLELIETLISPTFFHMSTPFVDGYNPMFYLQISGEGLAVATVRQRRRGGGYSIIWAI